MWPWLKRRRYADNDDDPTLQLWLDKHLGERPAFLRPGLVDETVLRELQASARGDEPQIDSMNCPHGLDPRPSASQIARFPCEPSASSQCR